MHNLPTVLLSKVQSRGFFPLGKDVLNTEAQHSSHV